MATQYVDVKYGERELVSYDFEGDGVGLNRFWRNLELHPHDRLIWNLCWRRDGNRCTISLVKQGTVPLPDYIPDNPIVILRYSM